VIGAPDDYRGEMLHAFVVLRADGRCGEGELQAYCAENLVKYKCPARISLVDRLPKTPVNKIDKKALQALT
jgi:long-chain acyl-CoA synthetase